MHFWGITGFKNNWWKFPLEVKNFIKVLLERVLWKKSIFSPKSACTGTSRHMFPACSAVHGRENRFRHVEQLQNNLFCHTNSCSDFFSLYQSALEIYHIRFFLIFGVSKFRGQIFLKRETKILGRSEIYKTVQDALFYCYVCFLQRGYWFTEFEKVYKSASWECTLEKINILTKNGM